MKKYRFAALVIAVFLMFMKSSRYAVDAQNGAQAWRADIGNVLSREVREKLGTDTKPTGWDYKQSSPIVVGGQVYVGSLEGSVYALAVDTGNINWIY